MQTQDSLAAKRARAIEQLGDRYILHPQYRFDEKHSNNTLIWYPRRTLRAVQIAAQQAGRL